MRPYTPLELAGRNIYVREGCYLCHSQMIRPMRDEVERYGHYSLAAEFDVRPSLPVGIEANRPGSRARRRPLFGRMARPAPDRPALRGAGFDHARLPASSPTGRLELKDFGDDLRRQRRCRRPLHRGHDRNAVADLSRAGRSERRHSRPRRAATPRPRSRDFDGDPTRMTEMDALVAYLQMLGTLVDFTSYESRRANAEEIDRWTTNSCALRRQLGPALP